MLRFQQNILNSLTHHITSGLSKLASFDSTTYIFLACLAILVVADLPLLKLAGASGTLKDAALSPKNLLRLSLYGGDTTIATFVKTQIGYTGDITTPMNLFKLGTGLLAIPQIRNRAGNFLVDVSSSIAQIDGATLRISAIAAMATFLVIWLSGVSTPGFLVSCANLASKYILDPAAQGVSFLEEFVSRIVFYFHPEVLFTDTITIDGRYMDFAHWRNLISLHWSILFGATSAIVIAINQEKWSYDTWGKNMAEIAGAAALGYAGTRIYNIIIIGVGKIFTDVKLWIAEDLLEAYPRWLLKPTESAHRKGAKVLRSKFSGAFSEALRYLGVKESMVDVASAWLDDSLSILYKCAASSYSYYSAAYSYVSEVFENFLPLQLVLFLARFMGTFAFWISTSWVLEKLITPEYQAIKVKLELMPRENITWFAGEIFLDSIVRQNMEASSAVFAAAQQLVQIDRAFFKSAAKILYGDNALPERSDRLKLFATLLEKTFSRYSEAEEMEERTASGLKSLVTRAKNISAGNVESGPYQFLPGESVATLLNALHQKLFEYYGEGVASM